MTRKTRLSAQERRASILGAAIPLFAAHGFAETTTRMIATAAGVSEALLYRHFRDKEAIFGEIKSFCCHQPDHYTEVIGRLEPSTSTLVHSLQFLMSLILLDQPQVGEADRLERDYIPRLLTRSILENGTFARIFYETHIKIWQSKWEQCVAASQEAGEMIDTGVPAANRWWFAHHIAVAIRLMHLPPDPVVDYDAPLPQLLDQAMRFALHGFGLTEAAIRTHYNPGALALQAQWPSAPMKLFSS